MGKASLGLWTVAAAGAVALHVAFGAISLISFNQEIEGDDLGATAIEVGLEMTAPRGEMVQAPPGPDAEETPLTPALQEQKAVVKETEVPKAKPTQTEEADRTVSLDDNKEKKTEVTEETSKQEQKAQDYTPAQEAAAMPTSDHLKESEKSAAPVLGIGESTQKLREDWGRTVSAIFRKNLRYPSDKLSKTIVRVMVSLTLDRRGHILNVSVATGAGDSSFDQEAVETVRRSDPLPPPVLAATEDSVTFLAPLNFCPPSSPRC